MRALLQEPPSVESSPVHEIPLSRLRALLRDFTDLLGQQMYFWGRDVIHPRGNLLCGSGFERRKSTGLEGTSCYRKTLVNGGFIELHGACAGFYDPDSETGDHFLYVRNRKRCFLYSEVEPPAPGFFVRDSLHCGPAVRLYFASLRFLDWWLEYERWVGTQTSAHWREKNYRDFGSLPASQPSLPPREAILWLIQYRDNPAKMPRLREQLRSLRA